METTRREVEQEEFHFTEGVILSETDVHGVITYANRRFSNVSGYARSELIGSQHNIIRHPEMPKELFRELWTTIQSGSVWEGVIKNLRKDGRFYWVHAYITPIWREWQIVGYLSVRRPADSEEIAEAKLKYKSLLIHEQTRNRTCLSSTPTII